MPRIERENGQILDNMDVSDAPYLNGTREPVRFSSASEKKSQELLQGKTNYSSYSGKRGNPENLHATADLADKLGLKKSGPIES